MDLRLGTGRLPRPLSDCPMLAVSGRESNAVDTIAGIVEDGDTGRMATNGLLTGIVEDGDTGRLAANGLLPPGSGNGPVTTMAGLARPDGTGSPHGRGTPAHMTPRSVAGSEQQSG